MSDYRRFISYIYAYERDIKSKNVGFAKVEVRNGECRITINIKGAFAASEKELETYLFYRDGQDLPGICLGRFLVKNGVGEFRCVTEAENISGSGMSLDEMCGIILCHEEEDSRTYASGWDDLAIVPQKLVAINSELKNPYMESLNVQKSVSENVELENSATQPVILEQRYEIPVIAAVEEEMRKLEAGEVQGSESPETEEPVIDMESMPEQSELVEQEGTQERDVEQPFKHILHNNLWERLEDSFPKITAFEDAPEVECLKIDLKALEHLPRENWGLANNSFLLHGYYNFRYLILGKMQEDEYMLGVPGMFHNNERFLAAMFGFEYFKPVTECKPLTGHFGYWYRRVILTPTENMR